MNCLTLCTILGFGFLAFGYSPPALAEWITNSLARRALQAICAKDQVDLNNRSCREAINYPDSDPSNPCNVDLGTFYQGNFLPGKHLLLISYDSDCRTSRASHFGGSALFIQEHGSLFFAGYFPGIKLDDTPVDCVVVRRPKVGESLLCLTFSMNQGIQVTSLTEINITQSNSGYVVSTEDKVTGEDTVGAFGAEQVDCSAHEKRFNVCGLSRCPR
jgi:hypothetical protein